MTGVDLLLLRTQLGLGCSLTVFVLQSEEVLICSGVGPNLYQVALHVSVLQYEDLESNCEKDSKP